MLDDRYIVHYCLNSIIMVEGKLLPRSHKNYNTICNNSFLALDYLNDICAVLWRYCDDCLKEGYLNPEFKNATQLRKILKKVKINKETIDIPGVYANIKIER